MQPARRMLAEGWHELIDPLTTGSLTPDPRVRCSDDARHFIVNDTPGSEEEAEQPPLLRLLLLRRRRRGEDIRASCGLFLVPKKGITHRLVFDARPATLRLRKLSGLVLPRLDDLLKSFKSLLATGEVFVFATHRRRRTLRFCSRRLKASRTPSWPRIWPSGRETVPLSGTRAMPVGWRFC